MVEENSEHIELPEIHEQRGGKSEPLKLQKLRIDTKRTEFVYRNCRMVNRCDMEMIFLAPEGLKKRMPQLNNRIF